MENAAHDVNVIAPENGDGKRIITYGVGDPVLIQVANKTFIGTIKEKNPDDIALPNGYLYMNVKNQDVKELPVEERHLEPLFFENAEGKKVWTKFSYNEVFRGLTNTPDFKFEVTNDKIVSLMMGNRSQLVPYEKLIDGKMVKVEGKIELRRDLNNNPTYHNLVKHKELNIDKVYGMSLTEDQKERLNKTGELGLVEGFKSGDKNYALWLSVDKDLNCVVTKREKDININKIYGVETTEAQKEQLKKGEGVLLDVKGKKLYVMVSAAHSKPDGLKIYSKEKAIELNFIKEEKAEKKKSNDKGIKR